MADPMYRNLAVLTGKAYLAWQAQRFADEAADDPGARSWYHPDRYQFSPASNFYVDVPQLMRLLEAAAAAVRGGLGAGWAPANAAAFSRDLTHWFDRARDTGPPACPSG